MLNPTFEYSIILNKSLFNEMYRHWASSNTIPIEETQNSSKMVTDYLRLQERISETNMLLRAIIKSQFRCVINY
jgi:hypothetical protein